ncbi:MAG: biotin-dependent carboxyltransferase family protein [Chthoniobacterales bacterium]
MGKVTILRAGPLLTVQDLGRPQHRSAGISPGGALDAHAARVANLLVGNQEEAALFEITFGPTRFRFRDERVVACCGAEVGIPLGKPLRVLPNEPLELSAPQRGCRSWLAIFGGLDVPKVLGSGSTDLRANFGGWEGRVLRDGDEQPLGRATDNLRFTGAQASWSAPNEWAQTPARHPILRVVVGAEWNDFTAEAQRRFQGKIFIVSAQADRMGARLEGPELARQNEIELISEAVAPGTIQVANDRQPILLLGDCQTIGGYPKIAHVITVDLPIAAQLRPDDSGRFQLVTLAEAHELFAAREKDLARFRVGLQLLTPR